MTESSRDHDCPCDELSRAVRAAGLDVFLRIDPEGLARAYETAKGYRSRRAPIGQPRLEPAHVFRAGVRRADE